MGEANAEPIEMSLVDVETQVPVKHRPDSRQQNSLLVNLAGIAGAYVGGLHSLFILEKGKPVVRPGRKAVDHDRPNKRRGSLVTEGMTVCHARHKRSR